MQARLSGIPPGNQNLQEPAPATKAPGAPEAFEFWSLLMASHWPPVKPSSIPNSADENLVSGLRDVLVPVGGSFSLEVALPTETIL
jgi:hypothetical protein